MSSNAESFGVKLNFDGQMRRFPLERDTTYKELREQVIALLELRKDANVMLKYADEEGDLITITSDLELSSALVPGKLLRLTATEIKNVGYPSLDAPMVDVGHPATAAPQGAETFRSFPGSWGPPGFGPHGHGPHGHGPHGHGPHEHGPHGHGPFRGGFGRGGHHHRGGHHGPRGGFHGLGPYGHPMHRRADMSPEEWHNFKKERKHCHKEMKKEWKDAHKCMKKEWKEGRGFGPGMMWGNTAWANERFVARFAKDVTIPDGTQLAPGTPFVKTWRIRNEGAEWPAGCVLRFLGKKSDKMGGQETVPLAIEGPVAPNTEIDVSANLVAPEKPGRYTGYWKMSTPDGRRFGQRVWASIVVPGYSSSSSSDSDKEADKYEALVDAVLATGLSCKRHKVFRMLQKTNGDVNLVCERLAKKEEKQTRKAMKKQMKI